MRENSRLAKLERSAPTVPCEFSADHDQLLAQRGDRPSLGIVLDSEASPTNPERAPKALSPRYSVDLDFEAGLLNRVDPARNLSNLRQRVIFWNVSRLGVSREIFIRLTPAG